MDVSEVLNPHLVRYPLCCLFGIVTLVDDIADLLAVHNEVDAVCGQCQEGVVDVAQLKKRKNNI